MMSLPAPWSDERLESSLPSLLDAGVNVVVEAAWVPRGVADPRGVALGKIRRIRNMVLQSGHQAALVTGPEQLEQVVRSGRIAVVIALEGGTALVEGEKTLREFRDLGLSVVGLTWSESSPYADSSAEPRKTGGGLTEAGRSLVRLCNDLGLVLDVSHMSDRATLETVELSRAPVLASHSNARALCDVPRNLSDSLLTAIARKGGLIGAMFHGPFVVSGRPATRADVVAQVRGLVQRVGVAHVGIGSDWDGIIKSPVGLAGSRDLPKLQADLGAAGLSATDVRAISGDNFLRFWRDVRSARATKASP
ncbi:MAG: peptidase [Deltaproteobacteria bacterium]|nr:peptidase [Deltaproteobacteria bacterium]